MRGTGSSSPSTLICPWIAPVRNLTTSRTPVTCSPSCRIKPPGWTTPSRSTRTSWICLVSFRIGEAKKKRILPFRKSPILKLPSALIGLEKAPEKCCPPPSAQPLMTKSLNLKPGFRSSPPSKATTPATIEAFPALIKRSVTSLSTTSKETLSPRTPLSSGTMNTAYFPGRTFSNLNSPLAFV